VVKSNQVIALIDPSTYQINVHKAEAQLANSKANLALATAQAERNSSLYTNHLVAAADYDTAIAQRDQAAAQVQSDEAALENAKVDLSRCTIYAPVDGVVISRNVDVGQTVAASFNTPTLFMIANDLSKMQIDALVSEADIGGVTVGQDVNFTVDAYPYRTFHGKLGQIRYGAITNQNVISYDCVVQVSNPDLKLLPGMTANVSIITAEREDALKIPNAALRFRPPEAIASEVKSNVTARAQEASARAAGGGAGRPGGSREGGGGREGGQGGGRPRSERQVTRTVYVLPAKAGDKDPVEVKPTPVEVKLGISDGITTEVTEGLHEGDQVVTGTIVLGEANSSRPANPFGGGFRRF
jgi:HlyD family secretion protein